MGADPAIMEVVCRPPVVQDATGFAVRLRPDPVVPEFLTGTWMAAGS